MKVVYYGNKMNTVPKEKKLKNEDDLKNEDNLKNEDDLKNWPFPQKHFLSKSLSP